MTDFFSLFISVSDEDSDLEAMDIEDNNESESKKSTTPEKSGSKRKVPCPQCGKSFSKKTNMTNHIKSQHEEKKFKCTICDKLFKRKDHLQVHKVVHSEERKFNCNVCSVSFRRRQDLKDHERTETHEKNLQVDKKTEKSIETKRMKL